MAGQTGFLDLMDDRYPDVPGFKERGGASEEAARLVEGRAATDRAKVLEVLESAPGGLTVLQIGDRLGYTRQQVAPRLTELATKNSAGNVYAFKEGRRDDKRSRVSLSVYKSLLFKQSPQIPQAAP